MHCKTYKICSIPHKLILYPLKRKGWKIHLFRLISASKKTPNQSSGWHYVSHSASACSAQCLFSFLSASDWHSTCRCSKRKPNSKSLCTMYNLQAWMPTQSQLKVRAEELQLNLSFRRNSGLTPEIYQWNCLAFSCLSPIQKVSSTFLDRILNMDWDSKQFTADSPAFPAGLFLSLLHSMQQYPVMGLLNAHAALCPYHSCTCSCISQF